MDHEQKERYVRWQDYRINQLTFSINLFLSFAVASLAYVINLKIKSMQSPINLEVTLPIYWWSVSAVLGAIASLSRLLDFRYTARKVKSSNICDKQKAKIFGKITWYSFWAQVVTYIVGGYVFISTLAFL